MKISHVLIALMMMAIVACTTSEKETPSGLKFTIVRSGDNVLATPGQYVVFDYTFKDSKDSVWDDTYANGRPQAMMVQDSAAIINEDGLTQMIRMLTKGDSAIAKIAITDFFKNYVHAPIPPGIDSTLMLSYHFNVREIMGAEDFRTYMTDLSQKLAEVQLGKDTVKIDNYLAEHNMTAQRTESGIRYVITQEGEGDLAQSGQSVDVNYAGYSLAGDYFDTSVEDVAKEQGLYVEGRPYQPYKVVIDQSSVIPGWHEALKHLNKGAKGTFFIPSTLAYGSRRLTEKVGANSVLIFDLEMVNIGE